MNQLTEQVLKAEQQNKEEKEQIRLLTHTLDTLKVELEHTKKTLVQVTEERDNAMTIITQLELHHMLSDITEFKKMTMQRNAGTTQKRVRLSER